MADQSGNHVFNALIIVALLSFVLKGVLSFTAQLQLRNHLGHIGLSSK